MKLATKHIIQVKNLNIGYTSKKEVKTIASNINIELNTGNLVCLLGKNGIGKSTSTKDFNKGTTKLKR